MTQDNNIKRSRRVVLTMMGSGAVGAVSMGLVPRDGCAPDGTRFVNGRPYGNCAVRYGGFGGGVFRAHDHGHAGHGHAGHGGG